MHPPTHTPHARPPANRCNEPGTFTAVSMLRPPKEHAFQAQQASLAAAVPLLARGNEQKWANSW